MWNSMAEELWGLRDGEVVGHKFLELDIGLPVKELGKPLRACLAGDSQREQRTLSATNRRGRPVDVEVSIVPLRDPAAEVRGAIVLVAVDGRPA
jgi:two-component system CheB/CheR fusion protein